MSDWRGAWYLARCDLKKNKWGLLILAALLLYLMLFLLPMHKEIVTGERIGIATWALDYIYMTLLPCLGLMSRQLMRFYWKTDPYTKKLASLRIMPISLKQIAMGRLIQLMVMLLPAQAIFYILYYYGIRMMEIETSLSSYLLHTFLWLGYSMIYSIAVIYLETGYSGKKYSIIYCLLMFVLLVFTVTYAITTGESIVIQLMQAIDKGYWWISAVGIAAGIAALPIGCRAITKRLERRQYSS